MSQSLSKMLVHLVFSTKDRTPFIFEEFKPELHAYLAGVLNAIKCPALQVGGVSDHVHLLFSLARTTAVAEVTEKVKVCSSAWAKREYPRLNRFAWQHGYGSFSVGVAEKPRIIDYIRGQDAHHAKMTFQDEYRQILREHEVEFDERYVWD